MFNATGRPEVSQQLREQAPGTLMVLNADRPFFSWEDFWDLIPVELSSIQEVAPLRLGIVGGGKGGHAAEGGHISNAAKVLRINRNTLYDKIKKYGLTP